MRAFGKIVLSLGCVTALVSAGAALAAEPAPPPHQTPQQLVDALYAAFGDHHDRAVHAKGIFLEGSFEPTAEAATLSKATLFSSGKLDLVARFSNFTGIPNIPDPSANANPRGFALQFYLPDDTQTDIVAHSFNGFPVATADEFGVLLRAIASSGPGAASPTALDQFLATHPIAKAFLTTQKPAPDSFSTLSYFGVNAFKFTAANGTTTFVRYRFVPQAGEHFVSAEDLKTKGN
ncbi:MAG TPA: catalase, partial [Rhizomicrobium sp.]|nr:catalase [Rhizomicrobium sp.]